MFNRRPHDPRDRRHESRAQSQLRPGPDVVPVKRDWVARTVLLLALVLLAISVFGVWLRFRPMPYDTAQWLESGGFDRGRMLSSLLGKTDFIGLTRTDVEYYLGPANFDERQFWYDLGPVNPELAPEPRAIVGDSSHLYGVFRYGQDDAIIEILYSYRRPTLGSAAFDSSGWFGGDPAIRRSMFTRALGRLRAMGLTRPFVLEFLGPPDGSRVRAQYDVGLAGAFIGPIKALIIDYDPDDKVIGSAVTD